MKRTLDGLRSLFDVNVLIALFDERHVHHTLAHEWWRNNQTNGWASCPLTQNGFVRILSQPKYPRPVSIGEAIGHLKKSIDRSDHAMWTDDVSLLDDDTFSQSVITRSKQITDLYLLALAVEHSGQLVTFDRNIPLQAVVRAKPKHLVVLALKEEDESGK